MNTAHVCRTLRPRVLEDFNILNKDHVASIRRTLSRRRLDPKHRFLPSKGFSCALTQAQADAFRVFSVIMEAGWLNDKQMQILQEHLVKCRERDEQDLTPTTTADVIDFARSVDFARGK